MKNLKSKELHSKSLEDLNEMAAKEQAVLFELRRKMGLREGKDTAGLKTQRHNIARIMTVIGEKSRGGK